MNRELPINMNNNKEPLSSLLSGIVNVTQLGLSVIVPIVLFALLANYLKNKFNTPDWLSLILIGLGFAGGINSFVIFVKSYLKRMDKK